MRRREFCAVLCAVVCAAAAPRPSHAIASVETESAQIEVIGNLRLLNAFFRYTPSPLLPTEDDGLSAAVGRIVAKGSSHIGLNFELNVFSDLGRTPAAGGLGGAFATASGFGSPYRSAELQSTFWHSGALRGQVGVDIARLHAAAGPIDIHVGRFAINHSVTFLYTPNDFFAPFSAASINTLYKPGVDAASARFAVGDFSAIELTGVLGRGAQRGHPRWGPSAILLRAQTLMGNFDSALLAGKLARRWVIGGSLQGELGPVGLRAEGHVGFADRNGDATLDVNRRGPYGSIERRRHGRVAVGIDKSFPQRNTSIAAEYCFISDGGASPAQYLERIVSSFPDDMPYLGRHHLGVSASTELSPLLRANLLLLHNATDNSGLGAAFLQYSLSDEADFIGGVMLPWGDTTATPAAPIPSELGLAPRNAYLETRFYF